MILAPSASFTGQVQLLKQSTNIQAAQSSVLVNTATIRAALLSRSHIATASAPHQLKQSAPSPSKRGQAVRMIPIPPVRSEKKLQIVPPSRPATVAGRVTSTSRMAPPPMTSRAPMRPATSASFRPPTRVRSTANARATTKQYDSQDRSLFSSSIAWKMRPKISCSTYDGTTNSTLSCFVL